MIGQRFGRLVVISLDSVRKERRWWLCLCDCGSKTAVMTKRLTSGHTRSCGCLRSEIHAEKCRSRATHRLTKTRTYKSWLSMKERCLNPNATRYPDYGAKGITICERWASSFEGFLADMGERPVGKTLDRIDGTKGYEPSNCRWATYAEQTYNTKRTKLNIDLVKAIRAAKPKGEAAQKLANQLGVSVATIHGVLAGRIWRHV